MNNACMVLSLNDLGMSYDFILRMIYLIVLLVVFIFLLAVTVVFRKGGKNKTKKEMNPEKKG